MIDQALCESERENLLEMLDQKEIVKCRGKVQVQWKLVGTNKVQIYILCKRNGNTAIKEITFRVARANGQDNIEFVTIPEGKEFFEGMAELLGRKCDFFNFS